MTAEEMWKESGLAGEYAAWSFGSDPDGLAALVKEGIKTATCSAHCFYEIEGEELPKKGDYNIILDSKDQAVCITRTSKVYTTAFNQVTEWHAFKEGEGDRTLKYWRDVHQKFFTEELQTIGQRFYESLQIVCEEFEVVWI